MSHSSNRRTWRYLGFITLLVVLVIGVAWLAGQAPATTTIALPTEITADDWKKGNPEASVVLVEYADFQCPACAATNPLINRLVSDYGDQMVLVFRHLPLTSIHANAFASSLAVEAAGKQDKFFEMGNMLFARQSEWSSLANPKDTFQSYAQSLGLNVDQFLTDYDSEAVETAVRADMQSAQAAGLSGTPTFFLNGKQFQQNPSNYDVWQALVEAELAETAQSPVAE